MIISKAERTGLGLDNWDHLVYDEISFSVRLLPAEEGRHKTMATMLLNTEKYKQAYLWMCNDLGRIEGKKKACKLLYFLDFDYYEAYEVPFTGETYISYPMGPVPQYFTDMTDEMVKEGLISRTYKREMPSHRLETVIYTPLKVSDYPFTDAERKMLARIVRKYGSLRGKDLENLTHAEVPYNSVDQREVIPYEFSFYRGTPDLME